MNEIEILKEISKDAKTGIDGINFTLDKVQDEHLKMLLYNEKNEYQNIYDRVKELLIQNNENSEDTSAFRKTMSWIGIQFNTLTDTSNSKIAEILIQGNDMGIIKGTKLLNNIEFKDNEIQNILQDFVRLQQKNIYNLKQYL